MLTSHSPCHFISRRALIPYTAQMKRSCQGATGGSRQVLHAGGWSDWTSCGDKGPLSVSVHSAAEPSRLVTYDNATVGAAAVRQRCASCIKELVVATLPPAVVFLGTSPRSSFLRTLSSFSHGGVLASIMFSGSCRRRRRCRRYVYQSKQLSKWIVSVSYRPIFFCIELNRIVSAVRCIVCSLVIWNI